MAKHSPLTSEYSKPHTSKSEPDEHVDQHSYDEHGKKDDKMTVPHITDKNAVDMGQQTHQRHQDQKK